MIDAYRDYLAALQRLDATRKGTKAYRQAYAECDRLWNAYMEVKR
jgi:hypothetical protein